MATVHVSESQWGLIFAAATLVIVVAGFPLLLRGGRRGGRGGRMRRGGYRIRYGPSLPLVLALALVRRLDAIVLAAATIAFAILIIWNARA